jgi:hypothetical protein
VGWFSTFHLEMTLQLSLPNKSLFSQRIRNSTMLGRNVPLRSHHMLTKKLRNVEENGNF